MLRHTTATNRWGGGGSIDLRSFIRTYHSRPTYTQKKVKWNCQSSNWVFWLSDTTAAAPLRIQFLKLFRFSIHLRRLSLNTHLLKSRQKKVFHSGECGGSTERAAVFSQCDGTSFSSSLRQQSQMRLFELVVLLILFRAVQNALWGLRLRRWCPECVWAVVSITWEINALLNLYYSSVDLKF